MHLTHRFTRPAIAALVVLTTTLAHAQPVATQQIDGVTFPASFPAAALNGLKVPNTGSTALGTGTQPKGTGTQPKGTQRRAPINTTSITTDLYVPGAIKGQNGEPPLAHCRNLAGGGRQCVTPAPEGGWPTGQVDLGVNLNR